MDSIKVEKLGQFTVDKSSRKVTKEEDTQKGIPIIRWPFKLTNQNLVEGFIYRTEGDQLNYVDDQLFSLEDWLSKNLPQKYELKSLGQFLMSRGLLKRTILSFWQDRYDEGLKLQATLFKGVVFLKELKTQMKIENQSQMRTNLQKSIYAGVKFEHFATENLGHAAEYYGVFRAHFSSLSIVYAAEIDGMCCGLNVELKTKGKSAFLSKDIIHKDFFKWCNQCRLADVDTVLIGLHENFILKDIHMRTLEEMKNEIPSTWFTESYSKAEKFLKGIKKQLEESPDGTIITAERPSGETYFSLLFSSPNSNTNLIVTEAFKAHQWT